MKSYLWIKHTVSEYQENKNTKAKTYILQDEDEYYNWSHVNMNIVNTEDLKTEQNVRN